MRAPTGGRKSYKPLSSLFLIACFALPPAAGQSPSARTPNPACDSTLRELEPQDFPIGVQRKLSGKELGCLREYLRGDREQYPKATAYYFGKLFNGQFVNILIYIDSAGNVARQAIVKGGAVVVDRVIRGEKFIYVLLFSDRNLSPPATKRGLSAIEPSQSPAQVGLTICCEVPKQEQRAKNAVRITRTSLNYEGDPFVSRLLKGFGSKLFGGAPEVAATTLPDTVNEVELYPIGAEKDSAAMYAGLARFRLVDNTYDRITVWPLPGADLRSIVTNFGNASRSFFSVGLGVGFTFDARTTDAIKDTLFQTGQQTRVNMYLMGHVHLHRPELPWQRSSYGLVFGTNILNDNLLHDLVAGVSVDRIASDLGIVVGINLLPTKKNLHEDSRVVRMFFAVGFQL